MTKPLVGGRFRAAEYTRTIWQATPEYGTPFEEVLKPGYWSHIAAQVKPWDRIEIKPEDASYFAELIVLVPDKVSVTVGLLYQVVFDEQVIATPPDQTVGFEVKWRGPISKWAALDPKGNVKQDKFESKELAEAWLKEHLSTTKPAARAA
jgi:hypothetical protein